MSFQILSMGIFIAVTAVFNMDEQGLLIAMDTVSVQR